LGVQVGFGELVALWLLYPHRKGQDRKRRQKLKSAQPQNSDVEKTIDLSGLNRRFAGEIRWW